MTLQKLNDTGPVSLEPGTIVRLSNGSRIHVGLVIANLGHVRGTGFTHVTAWTDGRLTRSNFGLGPLGNGSDPARVRTWSSTLSVVLRPSDVCRAARHTC